MYRYRKIVDTDGTTRWLRNGRSHRKSGPALIYADGSEEWYQDGLLHRIGGPASTEPDGSTKWLVEGKLHRDDGPAIEFAGGAKYWYRYNRLHRVGGPAVIYPDGRQQWYLYGEHKLLVDLAQGLATELGGGWSNEWPARVSFGIEDQCIRMSQNRNMVRISIRGLLWEFDLANPNMLTHIKRLAAQYFPQAGIILD